MKRDMDLVRDLLLWIEGLKAEANAKLIFSPDELGPVMAGADADETAYNLNLLYDAGFVQGDRGMSDFVISGLSWTGHDFADTV
jgi:hypothetical protein